MGGRGRRRGGGGREGKRETIEKGETIAKEREENGLDNINIRG